MEAIEDKTIIRAKIKTFKINIYLLECKIKELKQRQITTKKIEFEMTFKDE